MELNAVHRTLAMRHRHDDAVRSLRIDAQRCGSVARSTISEWYRAVCIGAGHPTNSPSPPCRTSVTFPWTGTLPRTMLPPNASPIA